MLRRPIVVRYSSPNITQSRSWSGVRRTFVTNSPQSQSSNSHSIKTIGVVGAGQMGMGIAQVAAHVAKLQVLVMDANKDSLSKSLNFMDSLMKKNISKGKMTEQDRDDVMARTKTVSSIKEFGNVDFVVEAVSESFNVKSSIFKELSIITPSNAILATNTSSISITKIAATTNRPDKVIGMHFMNPVPVMKLVEIIPGLATSSDTLNTTLSLAKAMGKTTAQSSDMPGFIANRLLMPYINEAIQALQDGIGTMKDIDTTMKLGTNVPMGPLELADFIGLDTCLAIMRVLHQDLGDSKYRPSPLLVKYVDAGWLGKKSGKGFYNYDEMNKPTK